jgi:excisionase family DNA binding protein
MAYRIAQAARAVGVSVSYMKRKVAEGPPHGPRSIKRGRMVLIPADALREWAGLREA